jgi:transcriptional regulator with XRE-family HTH domain
VPRGSGTKKASLVDRHVGARIRYRRNLLGLSQTELGDRIGVTFQQVQKYEKGANRIGSSRLLQICETLQVTPAWLFEGAMSSRKPAAADRPMDAAFAAFLADNMAHRVIAAWPQLPRRVRRLLVTLMVVLVSETSAPK